MTTSLIQRFWRKVQIDDSESCWLWQAFRNPKGYGMISNGGYMALAHRVSWAIHNGKVPANKYVLHRCDNPSCCNPKHLYIGTNADNVRDKVERGRSSWPRPERAGEGHPMVKLTTEAVMEIRSEIGIRGAGVRLARKYGVRPSTITMIQKGRLWKHLL